MSADSDGTKCTLLRGFWAEYRTSIISWRLSYFRLFQNFSSLWN